MSKINRRDAAKRAIIDIADYLAKDSILVGARFIDAVERTLKFLADSPEIGGLWESDHPRLQGVRVWTVDGFPNHLLFYRATPDGIDLILVCHGAQNLDSLVERL
jgi:plasmid stabilization system protein ParE